MLRRVVRRLEGRPPRRPDAPQVEDLHREGGRAAEQRQRHLRVRQRGDHLRPPREALHRGAHRLEDTVAARCVGNHVVTFFISFFFLTRKCIYAP